MPTTTNNGWPTPADTDLVKNGADAIRDLGNAIDTTLGVYSAVTPGLVKINTTSFSAVASQSINSVFSATYTNYKILIDISATSASNTDIYIRLRAGGTDTTANYKSQKIAASATTVSAAASYGGTGLWYAGIDGPSSGNSVNNYTLFAPNIAGKTTIVSNGFSPYASSQYIQIVNGQQTDSTQFDGFTLYPASGTITGKIAVYGLAI